MRVYMTSPRVEGADSASGNLLTVWKDLNIGLLMDAVRYTCGM